MKRRLGLLLLVFTMAFQPLARADEGMWPAHLLGDQVYNDMVKRGLKLPKEQLITNVLIVPYV